MTFKLETPELPAVTDGFLAGVNVIDGTGHQLFDTTKYELPLDGFNKDVPVSAGAVPAPVLVKGATNATGGTFTAGTFYWKITAVTGHGETTGSNEVTATLVATGSQALSWAAVANAELYRLYRGTAAGAENTLVATLGAATLAFTDTGAAGTAATVPTVSTAGQAPAAQKVFDDALDTNETVLFQSYRGMDSPLLLGEDAAKLVGDAYDRAESYGVGRKVQTLVLNPAAVDITPTPGTPVTNPRFALGLLEQWARDNSTFAGTISGNALALTLVEDAIDGLETIVGTPVVLASGYGTAGPGRTAGAGQAWLYIHGRITVWRGPSGPVEATDYRNNREIALAEGSYAASVDSFVAAVLVGTN
jgi:hypothetical protein